MAIFAHTGSMLKNWSYLILVILALACTKEVSSPIQAGPFTLITLDGITDVRKAIHLENNDIAFLGQIGNTPFVSIVDKDGQIVLTKKLSEFAPAIFNDLIVSQSGDLLIAGYQISKSTAHDSLTKYCLIRMSLSGQVLASVSGVAANSFNSSRTYYINRFNTITENSNGEICCSGEFIEQGFFRMRPHIMVFDLDLNLVINATLDQRPNNMFITDIEYSSDSTCLLTGYYGDSNSLVFQSPNTLFISYNISTKASPLIALGPMLSHSNGERSNGRLATQVLFEEPDIVNLYWHFSAPATSDRRMVREKFRRPLHRNNIDHVASLEFKGPGEFVFHKTVPFTKGYLLLGSSFTGTPPYKPVPLNAYVGAIDKQGNTLWEYSSSTKGQTETILSAQETGQEISLAGFIKRSNNFALFVCNLTSEGALLVK